MIANLQAHWGFTTMPFSRNIAVDNLFRGTAHSEAVARLRYLISARGLGVLTGEVGAGKTVAVRAATHGLDTSRHSVIYLANPAIGIRGLHGAIATALGQAPRFHHATLVPQVETALHAEAAEKGRHIILIIDEAHLLDGPQLEAVRMLTSCEMDSFSPLSIILVGQPALRRRLRVGDMAALDQRIQLRCHLPTPTMDNSETKKYITGYLALAGRSDTLFSDDAIAQIHSHARGIPRAINNLDAPRGASSYPQHSWEELGGRFLDPMANLESKDEGNSSLPEKQRSCSDVGDEALRDPRDTAKA